MEVGSWPVEGTLLVCFALRLWFLSDGAKRLERLAKGDERSAVAMALEEGSARRGWAYGLWAGIVGRERLFRYV